MAHSQHPSTTRPQLHFLQQYIPHARVKTLLEQYGVASGRERKLPADFLVYYLVTACLHSHLSLRETLRTILDQWIMSCGQQAKALREALATRSAVAQARARLGSAMLCELFQQLAHPCASDTTPGAYFKQWRLVIIDGTLLALRDTEKNFAHFDGPGKTIGAGAFPMLNLVTLVECGTHIIFGAAMAPYRTGEASLATSLLSQLHRGMLCLLDREYIGYPWWKAATKTQADFVIRQRKNMVFPVVKVFADGSYLSYMLPPAILKRQGAQPLPVRVIEYTVAGSDEVYRLLTSILDPDHATAQELAHLYMERWEVEITLRELKSTLRGGSLALLRSKTPDLVTQEVYAFLLAHYVIRRSMFESATLEGLDPDVLSFQHALNVIRRRLPQWVTTGKLRQVRMRLQDLLWEILEERVASSRGASVVRGVRRYSKYPIRPAGRTTPRNQNWTITILPAA